MDSELLLLVERVIQGTASSFSRANAPQLSKCSIKTMQTCLRQLKDFVVQNNVNKMHPLNHIIMDLMTSLEDEIRNHRPLSEQFPQPVGVIEERTTDSIGVLLNKEDFPMLYRGLDDTSRLYAHPDDYQLTSEPTPPQLFVYKMGVRTRLFMRLSFQIPQPSGSFSYTTATFVFDTGCVVHFLVSPLLNRLLKGRVEKNDTGDDFLKTTIGEISSPCIVRNDVPVSHQPANFMGLPMFFLLGVKFQHQKVSLLEYDDENVAIGAVEFAPFLFI